MIKDSKGDSLIEISTLESDESIAIDVTEEYNWHFARVVFNKTQLNELMIALKAVYSILK
jgi:hypothetical protein